MEPLLTAYLLDARALMPKNVHCSHRVHCQQVGDWDGESGRTHSGTKASSDSGTKASSDSGTKASSDSGTKSSSDSGTKASSDSAGGTASHVKSFQTSDFSGTMHFHL